MAAKPWLIVPLVLPAGGKEYSIDPVDYETGLTLLSAGTGKSKIKANTPDKDMFKLVMGPAWDEMLADRQPYPVMFRAGMASIQYQTMLVSGLDCEKAVAAGEAVWESGLNPEVVAAALAANQTTIPPKTSKRSTSTASGAKTPQRASTSPTTSRKGTPRTGSKAKPAGSPPGTK